MYDWSWAQEWVSWGLSFPDWTNTTSEVPPHWVSMLVSAECLTLRQWHHTGQHGNPAALGPSEMFEVKLCVYLINIELHGLRFCVWAPRSFVLVLQKAKGARSWKEATKFAWTILSAFGICKTSQWSQIKSIVILQMRHWRSWKTCRQFRHHTKKVTREQLRLIWKAFKKDLFEVVSGKECLNLVNGINFIWTSAAWNLEIWNGIVFNNNLYNPTKRLCQLPKEAFAKARYWTTNWSDYLLSLMEPIQFVLFFFAAFKGWHVPFFTLDKLSQLISKKPVRL